MRKPFVFFLTLLMSLSFLSAMAEQSTQAVFGETRVIDIVKNTNIVGTIAVVTADKDLMTDEELIEFYKTHIKGTSYNWYVIDFTDGTGYVFGGSSQVFTYLYKHDEHWRQLDPEMEIGMGFVWEFDDRVEYKDALKVPVLSTINEYQKWAKKNSIELRLLKEDYVTEVKKAREIVEIWETNLYPPDTLTIIVR